MNSALIKKEIDDILAEKLYVFAFFTQVVIVMGILYAALLYTSVAAPHTSSFVQTQRPKFGVMGTDVEIVAQLQENLEIVQVTGDPEELIRRLDLVGVLLIKNEKEFEIVLDNANILSGYADTIVTDFLSKRSSAMKRTDLEEKMETADVVLNPINLVEIPVGGERTVNYPPEFIVIMYGLLIPFIILLPTFLATNMVTDSIVGEKERKTYEVLIAAPLSKRAVLLSKIMPILFVAMGQSFLWILLLLYKGLPVYNIPLLLILLLIVDTVFIGLGVFISAISDTLKESNLSVTIALLVTSVAMFAPLPFKTRIQSLNPIILMTKLASNPTVPLRDLAPIIPITILAVLILLAGEYMLKKKENLRL